MSMIALLLLTIVKRGLTAPLNQDYVSWKIEPNERGTWSILTSCVITLILCAYSAVHMQISHPYETTLKRKLRLLRWVLAGIYVPEFVVLMAWDQWCIARQLSNRIDDLRHTKPRQKEDMPFNPLYHHKFRSLHDLADTWTLQHSFFVGMGGFQFSPAKVALNPDTPHQPRCIIGGDVLLALLNKGHVDKIPVVTKKELADRSKADHLAKVLSCIQGLWLAVQLLGRLVAHITITELEVNTFAHALCLVAMYAFWMHKPLSSEQPLWISTEGLDDWILALSGLSKSTRRGLKWSGEGNLDALRPKRFRPHKHDASEWEALFKCQQCSIQRSELSRTKAVSLFYTGTGLDPDRVIEELSHSRDDCFIDFLLYGEIAEEITWSTDIALNPYPFVLFEIRGQDELETLLQVWQMSERVKLIDLYKKGMSLHRRMAMWDTRSDCDDPDPVYLCMPLVSCVYGALHASLWHHHFPTVIEQWLWRISSIMVAGDGLFLLITLVIFEYWDLLSKSLTTSVKRSLKNIYRALFIVVQILVLYGRAFLLVEAFISLRSQPPSAYETPQWSQWFPHL